MDNNFVKNYRENASLRESFFDLAKKSFNLPMAKWYEMGYWMDSYMPYSIEHKGAVVANVSANIIHVDMSGQKLCFIQIGTVMTDPEYRGRGFSKRLMESLISDWSGKCDGFYLYANSGVLNFYPKFGFKEEYEYSVTKQLKPAPMKIRRLDMGIREDVELLKRCYERSNPFTALNVTDNFALLMFYCAFYMRDCVYYLDECDAAVIAGDEDGIFTCHDIFCPEGMDMDKILSAIVPQDGKVTLGFSPKDESNCSVNVVKEDGAMFALCQNGVFLGSKLRFPLLSRA